MNQLVEHPGSFRKQDVGIIKGSKVEHLAPPSENIPYLMKDLFTYLKKDEELILIKSCVFHYELEFIHPFMDGNGRMGRLWQIIILVSRYPVFQYLALETLLSKNQNEYNQVLAKCENAGNSTEFIEFMLQQINLSLDHLLKGSTSIQLTQENRLEHFVSLQYDSFTRKDYMIEFKNISGATASRDLKAGVEKGLFSKQGDKRLTTYKLN